jgi:hypothetical protein
MRPKLGIVLVIMSFNNKSYIELLEVLFLGLEDKNHYGSCIDKIYIDAT